MMTKVIVLNDYSRKLTELDARAAHLHERLAELAASRRDLVVRAADSDESALRDVMTNEAEVSRVNAEIALVDDAREEIEGEGLGCSPGARPSTIDSAERLFRPR
jgi:chromosome segregation ATPase